MSAMSEEETPFIDSKSQEHGSAEHGRDSSECCHAQHVKAARRHAILWPLLVHAAVFVLYMVPLLWLRQPSLPPAYSPADAAIQHEYRPTPPHQNHNPLAGEPRPELDQAWHRLLEGTFVSLPAEDFERANATSVPLTDGSGYLGQLAVFHELHCMKKIRQYIHWDYYFPNATKEYHDIQLEHMDHCLEKLRVDAMCRANTALIPFQMRPVGRDGAILPAQYYPTHEKCVKWEPLQEWAKQHAIDTSALPEGPL